MGRITSYKGVRITIRSYRLADIEGWGARFTLTRMEGSVKVNTEYHLGKAAFQEENTAIQGALDQAHRVIDLGRPAWA